MSTWFGEIVFSPSSSSVSEHLIPLFSSLMKVSLVKNLFPGMAGGNRSWIQKHPELGVIHCSRTHMGKGCHLVVSLMICTSVSCPSAEAGTLEERSLQAGFLQDDVDAFRNHLDSVQVPSEVGFSGYSACILSFSRQGQASQTLCRLSRTASKQLHSENTQPDTYVQCTHCVPGRQPTEKHPGQGKGIM